MRREECQGFSAWRLEGESLQSSGRMRADSVWLEDDEGEQQQDADAGSVPALLSQAQARKHASSGSALFQSSGSLFQTGTGRSVEVSNAAIKRALALLGGGDEGIAAAATKKAAPSLFQTGTGKAVSVSASAMNKARQLLQEGHSHSDVVLKPSSFSTGGNLRKLPASVPPFKQPRRRFTSPLTSTSMLQPRIAACETPVTSEITIDKSSPRKGIGMELSGTSPEEFKMPVRINLHMYFQHPPQRRMEYPIAREIQLMTSDAAKDYTFSFGSQGQKVGPLEIRSMLLEAGARPHMATLEWTENHYRLIVWKLASQERSYPKKARGFLSLSNVLRELKYRYKREIGFGHRSIIRKICERDISAGHPMVLCISAIRVADQQKSARPTVEVTDGW